MLNKFPCDRCGGDHPVSSCPEVARDKNIAKQTKILESQEERIKSENKSRVKAEKEAVKAAKLADPNYKSPTKKLFKFFLWSFVFVFSFAGFAKLVEAGLAHWFIIIVCIVGIAYWFKKRK
jgi:hypothetical protein